MQGSLAFGSLILAIVRFIRVILEYVDEKLKTAKNPVAEFAMKSVLLVAKSPVLTSHMLLSRCLKCCFWCLEKCLKFLNRNAYILIAVYGNSFCPAAKDAFMLLMRNIVRVWVLDKVSDFLLFLGKLLITIGMGQFRQSTLVIKLKERSQTNPRILRDCFFIAESPSLLQAPWRTSTSAVGGVGTNSWWSN